MEANTAHFACHKCGKPYDWTPQIVGKTAKCACGAVLRIPSAPPGTSQANQEAVYKEPNPGCIVPTSPEATESIPPAPGEPQTAHEAIISLYQPVAGQNRARAPMELADEELDPKVQAELNDLAQYGDKEDEQKKHNPYLDLHLPLILLGIGLMLMFGEASFHSHRHHGSLFASLFKVSASLILNIILVIIAMVGAAKFSGIYFGKIPTAILKIAALYVAPTTLGSLLTEVLGGELPVQILGYAVNFILIWALLVYLFRLDGSQTMACVICIGILSMISQLFLVGAMLSALGASMGSGDVDAIEQGQSIQLNQ
ncbi:MAG TPA: hypothetical protein VGP94_14620 [Tepidisphaeraceae bacterium]|nr:hypothetical protein [Tepidisphaeraceae bacterium]